MAAFNPKAPESEAPPPEGRTNTTQWLLVLVWAAVIFTLSTSYFGAGSTSHVINAILGVVAPWMSAGAVAVTGALIRKLAHFVEYAILYWLLARGPCARRPWLALVICLLYACADEYHQSFVADRTASVLDVGIDFSGALFSHFLRLALYEISPRRASGVAL